MAQPASHSLEKTVRGFSTHWSLELLYTLFGAILLPITLLALTYPPPHVEQGQAHRIFYVHVPIAWVALYAPLFSAVAGLMYLFTRNERYDVWSVANARLSLLFSVGVVITGSLWAASAWGVYWNWLDSRLMSFFILGLVLVGYFLVRNFTEDPRKQRTFSAAMAVLAACAAVLTWLAIRVTTPESHPTSVLGTMDPSIRQTFWLSVLAYHLFFWTLLRLVVRQEYLRRIFLYEQARLTESE